MTDILEQWRSAKERWIISGEANEMIVGLETEIERLREALRALVIAVEYKGPPVDFGEGNLCWEARIPVAFVDKARAALGEGKNDSPAAD